MKENWAISSYSASGANCVEVSAGHVVQVRDTKDRGRGRMTVGPAAWRAFLAGNGSPSQPMSR